MHETAHVSTCSGRCVGVAGEYSIFPLLRTFVSIGSELFTDTVLNFSFSHALLHFSF